MVMRKQISNREDWLSERLFGIGGSEASSVAGINPYMSKAKLKKLKLCKTEPDDLSDNPSVQRGIQMEPILRDMYQVLHGDITIEYHAYDLLYQSDRPWLYATLDGEITDGNKHGILEIKTCEPKFKGWEQWDGKIPDYYYCQILHQLLATDYDYAVLMAMLIKADGNSEIREYRIDKADVTEDMNWLLEQETLFWNELMKEKEK